MTWGEVLSNCLGGYATRIAYQLTLVLGIRVDNQLCGAVQIDPAGRRMVQMVGLRNAAIDPDIGRKVETLLTRQRVITRVRPVPHA